MLFRADVFAPFEHQVLEQVGETRFAGRFVPCSRRDTTPEASRPARADLPA
jgi:hypothetical protein